MTPSQQAKAEGLKSLSQASKMTDQSLQTLSNWAKNKPELFKIVLLGCKAKLALLEVSYESKKNRRDHS